MARKKKYRCSVKGCLKLSTDGFFSFPLNEIRSQLWVERCCNEELHHISTKKLAASRKVCGRHFARHAYTNHLKNRLNSNAVPSIFDRSFFVETNSAQAAGSKEIPMESQEHYLPDPVSASAATAEEILTQELYQVVSPPPITEECHSPNLSLTNIKEIPNGKECSKSLSSPDPAQIDIKKPPVGQPNHNSTKAYHNNNLKQTSCSVAKPTYIVNTSCGLTGCDEDLYSDETNVKELVKCSSKCGKLFHLQCTGLEKVEYEIICNNDALRWFCVECRMCR